MKKLTILAITAILLPLKGHAWPQNNVASGAAAYIGSWEYEKDVQGSDTPYSNFTLDISYKDGEITGKSCYVTQFGGRADCDPKAPANIHGTLGKNGDVNATFSSYSGATGGQAIISRQGSNLSWVVVRAPNGDGFYGPMKSVLKKSTNVEITPSKASTKNDLEKEVVSEKAYLFNDASETSLTKAYLIKGDRVNLEHQSDNKNYWFVKYTSPKGKEIKKWVRCEDIDACN